MELALQRNQSLVEGSPWNVEVNDSWREYVDMTIKRQAVINEKVADK